MCDDSRTTTHADSDTIAEFGRRLKEEFLRAGSDRVTVVLPGDEPLEFRVFLCKDADEAAACLQRHWRGKEGRNR